eukprot:9475984-Pyramimonas_sp.AAC.1
MRDASEIQHLEKDPPSICEAVASVSGEYVRREGGSGILNTARPPICETAADDKARATVRKSQGNRPACPAETSGGATRED